MLVVTAAIIEENGKILIGRRAPDQPRAGLWEFPGGKLLPGESPEDGLRRELQEELGVETRVVRHYRDTSANVDGRDILLRFYKVRIDSGIPGKCVHDRLEWIERGRLPDYAFLPADIDVAIQLSLEKQSDVR